MKKVLVTGANGWIGKNVLQPLLEKGYEVHATSTKVVDSSNQYQWHNVNLLHFQDIKEVMKQVKPTHLLHLAWEATPGQYWMSKDNYQWVQSSIELISHFVDHGGQRVVVAGTCAEYDWDYGYLTEETTPCSYKTPYAASKNALRLLVHSFSELVGLSYGWGRVFFLYGPNEHPRRLVPSVISSILHKEEILCTHGEQYRDFLHVKDVANAFVALLESDIQGTVNIASGQPVQVKELILKIAQKLGYHQPIQFGAIPYPENESTFMAANAERLRHIVGFSPKHTLDSGIEESIQWWKNNDSNPF
ncbi:nucleoside-diphosphate-sugar epimerase [Croceifilum oryzae]|uniref:Nucleoside-diphosphate-sugar epimerase n=1 Tax=Croceifilum oryzae TaxID=1553429 RepID=A0AAJ1TDS5_9BACL|nr:NAD-dependent epimerase/dehydratase family protein [Croceifilum oryzae]MDQ0417050.1 nucleoside-diphosphate-sugar epimerase [Croceifilum oryzae]